MSLPELAVQMVLSRSSAPALQILQILASRPLWGHVELGRISVAFHLRAAAFQLGLEMSRFWWWRGGRREALPQWGALAPGRKGWWPEAGSHLQVRAAGGARAAPGFPHRAHKGAECWAAEGNY